METRKTSRFAQPETPQVVLTEADINKPERQWGEDAQALMAEGASGTYRVRGVAGSGKTSLLVETAIARLKQGLPGSGLLIISPSKDTAIRVRRQLVEELRAEDPEGTSFVSDGAMVRSVHSLAFGLLHKAAARLRHEQSKNAEEATLGEVRLITGAEQDQVIRELLEGDADRGGEYWPEEYRPALKMLGFARQLRDFLLRAIERGLTPQRLQELGQTYQRPIWTAAGYFLDEYEKTQALAGPRNLSAPELLNAALAIFDQAEDDPKLHTLLIDDAQNLDPTSAELLQLLMPATQLVVIAGDEEQSVFRFRGANPDFLLKTAVDKEIDLGPSHRNPSVRVATVDGANSEMVFVADAIRRAHLLQDVPWKDIAVITRNDSQLRGLKRVLAAADIPMHMGGSAIVLSEYTIVTGILFGLQALYRELSDHEFERLMVGPIGGSDPVMLKRLLRRLRLCEIHLGGQRPAIKFLQDLVDPSRAEVAEEEAEIERTLNSREKQILERMRRVMAAAYKAHSNNGSLEDVLWALWDATGLSHRLLAESLRGGAAGAQADMDLDAMMALFDAAGEFVQRRPNATIEAFVRHIMEQELATGVRERRAVERDAVTLVKAHSAVGRQWHSVIVCGVQEGIWPQMGATGSLFEQDKFIDLLDEGIDPSIPISQASEQLAEERRLFKLACHRATDQLLVTAVTEGADEDLQEPSRFLDELCKEYSIEEPAQVSTQVLGATETPLDNASPTGGQAWLRHMSVPSLIGELRSVLCSENSMISDATRQQAARQLARLAEAGIYGAHPDDWWATTEPSTNEPLEHGDVVWLSPSQVENLDRCPMCAVLGRLIEDEETPLQLTRGILVHAYAEAVSQGAPREEAAKLTADAYADSLREPESMHASMIATFEEVLDAVNNWLDNEKPEAASELVAAEKSFEVLLPKPEGSDVQVGLRGRIDRVDRLIGNQKLRIIDFKSSKSLVSVAEGRVNKQLECYQFALFQELQAEGTDPGTQNLWEETLDSARLVFPAAATNANMPKERDQFAMAEDALEQFALKLQRLGEESLGPVLRASHGKHCKYSKIRDISPVGSGGSYACDQKIQNQDLTFLDHPLIQQESNVGTAD